MTRNEMLQHVNTVFRETLDNDQLIISESTAASDIEEWDSLTHIQLVVAIEKKFFIRFNSMEINSWKNVGEMLDCIQRKGI